MTPDDVLAALKAYYLELREILDRFTSDSRGIHIERQDNYRLRTIVTELIDLLRDHVPGSGQHIQLIVNSYNEGIGFYQSSLYSSVEEIRGVVAAVITPVERNKSLFVESTGPISTAPEQRKLLYALDQLVVRF